MKKIVFVLAAMALTAPAFSQKYMTRTGKISFYSATPLESIEAINNEVAAVINSQTGEVVFQVPVKSFKFDRQLMQEHFNENYMESDKYPKSDFKGKITNPSAVNFSKDGSYNVTVEGKLTIHGVTQSVSVPGTVVVKSGAPTVNTKFKVKPQDYGIKIPSLVAGKIAEKIEITVNTVLKAM
ncbi:YceI family protein [Chitinophagaceae bacterium MMS25-I14]